MQATKRGRRDKRLHLMFFVDAARSKSLTVSLRVLAILGAGTALVALGSVAALWHSFSQMARAREDISYIRELKSGLLAQSVTFERVLQSNVTQDDKLSLSTKARALEKEIVGLAAAPLSSNSIEIRDASDLRKVTNTLTNLNKATINLVAAGGGSDSLVPSADSAPANSASEAKRARDVALSEKTDTQGSTDHDRTTRGDAAPSLDKRINRTAPSGAHTAPPSTALASAPDGPTVVTFESVSLSHRLVADTSSSPATEAEADAEVDETEAGGGEGEGSLVRFQLVNSNAAGQPLWGRVCGVALLDTGVEAQPAGLRLKTVPGGLPELPAGCRGGQTVRFSKLRPSTLQFKAAPDKIRAVALYFFEGTEMTSHSRLWKNDAR